MITGRPSGGGAYSTGGLPQADVLDARRGRRRLPRRRRPLPPSPTSHRSPLGRLRGVAAAWRARFPSFQLRGMRQETWGNSAREEREYVAGLILGASRWVAGEASVAR